MIRSRITAHLAEDLAAIYDATVIRRGQIARMRLAQGIDGPELAAVTVEAEDLDATLQTLRSPESTAVELDWIRSWSARTAQLEAPAAEAQAPEAVAPGPEPELEAAL